MSNIKEAFKRFLSIALSVTTTVWLSGLTLLLPASPALAVAPGDFGLKEGDLIRAPSLPAPEGFKVYIINDGGFKRHIFNPDVFNMYGHLKWENIKDVAANVVTSFTTSDLYRIDGDPRVWSVDPNGVRHWINMTADQYVQKGYKWEQIFLINEKEGNYYTQGSDITPGTTPPPPPVVPTGSVSASLSPSTPVANTLAASTVFNNVLTVRFMAGAQAASISGLTLTKGGLIANSNVSGISLWQGSKRVSNVLTSLTSAGKATFVLGTPVSVPASSSVDLDVKINLGSGATSGTLNFMVSSVGDVSASGTVTGTFPVQGNTFSLASAGAIGAYTLSAQSVGGTSSDFPASGSGNIEIGVAGREIGKFQVNETSGKEDLLVKQVTIYTQGSVREGDLLNWKLYDPNNAELSTGTVALPYVTFDLATPYRVPQGTNRNLSVKVDPMDGADRTIRLHIQNDYDLIVQGEQTGAFIAPSSFADTASSDGYFRLKQGALTVSKTVASPSGNLAPGATDVELARFDLRATGEQLEIRKLDLEIVEAVSTSTQLLTGNVKIQSGDGAVTYLSVAADTANIQRTSNTVESTRSDLNTYIVIPSGTTKTVKVVGTLKTTVGASQTYKVKIGNYNAWRSSTKDFADLLPSTYTDGNTLTVQTSALTVAKNTSIGDRNVAKGAVNELVGSFTFQAGSAEDVNISSITIGYSATPADELRNVKVMVDGAQFGSTTVGTPNATSDSFTGTLVVKKSTTALVEVRANVESGVTTDDTVAMKVNAVSATGKDTGNTITAASTAGVALSTTAITGQTVTYKTGTLTISRDANSPAASIIIAGTSGLELEKVRFEALNDALTLKKVRFEASVSGAGKYVSKLFLCDGTSDTSSACATGVNLVGDEALFDGLSIALSPGTAKVLTLKANLSAAADGVKQASDVAAFAMRIKSDGSSDMQVTGSQGDLTADSINDSGSNTAIAASNSMLFHLTQPVITKDTVSSTSLGGSTEQEIFKFKVTSKNANVELNVGEIKIALTASGMNTAGSIRTFKLYKGSALVAQNLTTVLNTSTATATLTFNQDNEQNDAFDSATSNDTSFDFNEGITVGSSDVFFTLKADTTAASTGVASGGTVTLVSELSGTRGASSGDTAQEDGWANGNLFYSYKLQDGSGTYIGSGAATTSSANHFSASDSYSIATQVLEKKN